MLLIAGLNEQNMREDGYMKKHGYWQTANFYRLETSRASKNGIFLWAKLFYLFIFIFTMV